MTLPPLRTYQQDAIDSLRTSLAQGARAPVLVAPTGSGKTRLSVEIIRRAAEKGKWVLVLAPRRELIYQFSAALEGARVVHGVIMAGEPSNRYARIQVASFDTLWARRTRIHMPPADLVVVDECHLSLATTRRKLIEAYPEARIVGLTATPARGDGKGLGGIYDALVPSWSVGQLIDAGFLVPVRYYAPEAPDLTGIKLNKDGDYVEKQLGVRMDQSKLIGDIVDNWFRIAEGKSTVVFCTTRAHSRHVCEEFVRHGVRAEHLDGETDLDDRAAILARVASGATTVLCNVFVATYGLDIPRLECAVLARPTRNITLYVQTIGRVLRPAPGKTDAVVIDHSGAVAQHGFVEDPIPWSLDDTKTVAERKQQEQQEKQAPKEITCPACKTVFKSRRDCPACGHEAVPKGKPLPFHEAKLVEVERGNRVTPWEEKCDFMRGLRGHAQAKGYKEGWAAHAYREKFGVWPNDPRLKHSGLGEPSTEVLNWVKYLRIRNAKRNAA